MARKELTPEEAIGEFWKHMKDGVTVMLGIDAPGNHAQPMTAFHAEGTNSLWFFTRDDIDLVRDAATRHDGRMLVMSKDKEVYGDIRGSLEIARDRAVVERHWSPMVAAWYPEGKDDPHLILLRFTPEEGQLWVSKQSFLGLAFAVAKANLTKTMPHEGSLHIVNFQEGSIKNPSRLM